MELTRLAAAKLPVPDYVMNDQIRALEVTEEDLYFTVSDGRYVNRIYSGVELREPERVEVEKFGAWVAENQLFMPSGFTDEHNYVLRYLNTAKQDYQQVYDDIIENDRYLRNVVVPLFENYENMIDLLESGVIYGY